MTALIWSTTVKAVRHKTVVTSHQDLALNQILNYEFRIMHRKIFFKLGLTKP